MSTQTGATRWARRMAAPVAVLVGAAVLASGCGAVKEAVAEVTTKDTLLASVPNGDEGAFRFTGKDVTGDYSGSVDPAAKGVEIAVAAKDPEHGFTTRMAFRVVGDEVWTKISFSDTEGLTGLPKIPNKWLKLDRSKLTDAESAPVFEGADVGNTGPLLEAATTVNDDGAGKYSGTIDLTSGEAAKVLEAEQVTALGDAAKNVPFTAVVGADKNLASLTLDVPAAGDSKAFKYVVNYQEYGKAPKLAAPTGSQAQAAPPVAYEILNG